MKKTTSIKVNEVLHMNGGDDDTSYANNSSLQRRVLSMGKSIRDEAMLSLLDASSFQKSICISVADLGCSSGPNAFFVVSDLMDTILSKYRLMGHKSPEFLVYLNDLPGNDFNDIFRSLQGFYNIIKETKGIQFGDALVFGVPGTFYGKLFPAKSLQFVHSSCSLHWLSRVPRGLECNKRNIYMSKSSPQSVLDAYLDQFNNDFCLFLKMRSVEVVSGGKMVLTTLGRRSVERSSKDCCHIWDLLSMALNDMVSQGLIEEEKVQSFNSPLYTPSPMEITNFIKEEGSFCLDQLQIFDVEWTLVENDDFEVGNYIAKCMRAAIESLLASHFGTNIIDKLFERYGCIIEESAAKEKNKFVIITVSMTRAS